MVKMYRRASNAAIEWLAENFEKPQCVWLFMSFPLIGFGWTAAMPFIALVSSNWIQLWALPAISVANKLQSAKLAAQSKEQHDAIMKILEWQGAIISELHAISSSISTALTEFHALSAELHEQHAADLAALHLKHDDSAATIAEIHAHLKDNADAGKQPL